MEGNEAHSDCKKNRIRCSNVYVPPPARKSPNQVVNSSERTVNSRRSAYDGTKACNDSSLLFLNDAGHSYSKEKQKNPRKRVKSKKRQNTENNLDPAKNEENPNDLIDDPKTQYLNSSGEEAVVPTEQNLEAIQQSSAHEMIALTCDLNKDEDLEINSCDDHIEKNDLLTLFNELDIDCSNNSYNPSETISFDDEKRVLDTLTDTNTVKNVDIAEVHVLNTSLCKSDSEENEKLMVRKSDISEIDGLGIGYASDKENKVVCSSDHLLRTDENDWESLYDDSGECLAEADEPKSDVVRGVLLKKKTSKEHDDSEDSSKESELENKSSIIELYGFPKEVKTNDLMTVLSGHTTRCLKISWVDETHALAIFPTPKLADEVLASDLPLFKTRPLVMGTQASQEKARNLVLPSTLRPKTCPAMARRLVSGALGLRMSVTPEVMEAEKEILRKAREEKRLAAKQRDAAWEGVFETDEVLTCDLPLLKNRHIIQGTQQSSDKARNILLPSALRPKTCPAMARRLVSGALGLRMSVTPEVIEAEEEILRKAREEKKLAAKKKSAGVIDK